MPWNDERVKKHFSFVCPKQWADMESTDDEGVRFCQDCQKPVVDVRSPQELKAIMRSGGCASIQMNNGQSLVSAPQENQYQEPQQENEQHTPRPADPYNPSIRTSGTIPEDLIPPQPPPFRDEDYGRTSGTIPPHYLRRPNPIKRMMFILLFGALAITAVYCYQEQIANLFQ